MRALAAVIREHAAKCFHPDDLARLKAKVDLVPADPRTEAPETIGLDWIEARAADVEFLITCWGTPNLPNEFFDRPNRLRGIVHAAGTVKALIPPRAYEKGIAVTNCRRALATGVAETALGLLLASAKMFVPLHRVVADGGWREDEWLDWVTEPYRVRVGVVGASQVGRHFLGLLRVFEVERLVYDPYASADEIAALGGRKVELDELCSTCEFVVICAPATEETRHLIDRRRLALMKDRTRVINPARGAIIDETALAEEVTRGRLYACLDVFDPEPPRPDHPLRTSPYCLLTPHIAGSVNNARLRQGRLVVDEILHFLEHGRFVWQVDPRTLARMA